VLRAVASFNGGECSLTAERLAAAGGGGGGAEKAMGSDSRAHSERGDVTRKTVAGAVSETVKASWMHVRALFRTRKMAWSTSLLIALWGLIGLASTLYNSFLPFLFASKGAVFQDGSVNITYRNTFILSVTGVPGAFLAGWAVDLPIGRRGTLMLGCFATAVFLFGTTTARSSNALLGWNCAYSFFSNIMYGVLYAISPEIFPAKDRGTGNGLVSIATRVFGVLAPIIALFANLQTAVPVYISGALIFLAGLIALLLPFEPRGKASL